MCDWRTSLERNLKSLAATLGSKTVLPLFQGYIEKTYAKDPTKKYRILSQFDSLRNCQIVSNSSLSPEERIQAARDVAASEQGLRLVLGISKTEVETLSWSNELAKLKDTADFVFNRLTVEGSSLHQVFVDFCNDPEQLKFCPRNLLACKDVGKGKKKKSQVSNYICKLKKIAAAHDAQWRFSRALLTGIEPKKQVSLLAR